MKLSTAGEIVIPAEIRKEAGMIPGCEVRISLLNGAVLIEKVLDVDARMAAIDRMVGRGDINMTTDEILAITRGDD